MGNEKIEALQKTLKEIEKEFGKGAIMRLGDLAQEKVEVIPTGSIALDLALGIGGIPRGRVIEIYGPESGGKTTLALTIVAQAQRLGGVAAFIDAEHALDPVYARKLGVDVENLLVSQPDYGEQALEIMELLVRSAAVDVIVVDSVAALTPKAEIEGEMGDSHVGLQARMMGQALRKLTAVLSKSNTAAIFINQVREKVGPSYGGPQETTPGGRALKFFSSVRIDVRRNGPPIKEKGEAVGIKVRAKVTKNKLAPPFRQAELEIYFGSGVNPLIDLLNVATSLGIIQKSASWFSYGDIRLGHGRDNSVEFLKENPKLIEEIRSKVLENKDRLVVAVPAEEDEETVEQTE